MLCSSSAVTTATTATTIDGRLGVRRLPCRGRTLTARGGKSSRTCCPPSSPSSACCRPMLDSTGNCCCSGGSRPAAATAAQRVTKKYRVAAVKRREYLKLKAIVPAVSTCRTVSKLTVIEEAIKYIDILHATLATRIGFNGTSSDFCGDQRERPRNPDVDPDEFIRQLCFGSFHAARSMTSSVAATGSDGAAIGAAGHHRPTSQRQQQPQQRQQSWRSLQATTSSRPPLAERQRVADGRSLALPPTVAAAAVAVVSTDTRTESPTPAII